MCIGGPYILNLLKIAPERVTASVVMQTIGRDNNYQEFLDMFNGWSEYLQALDPQRFSGHLLEPMRARMLENDLTFMCMTEVDDAGAVWPNADLGWQRYLSPGFFLRATGGATASGPAH